MSCFRSIKSEVSALLLGVCLTQQDTTDVGLGTGHGRSPEASPSASAFKRVLNEGWGRWELAGNSISPLRPPRHSP